MSSTHTNLLFFFPNQSLLTDLTYELSICAVVLITAAFALWLAPGGLAWALTRARLRNSVAIIPGPSGVPLCGLLYAFTGPTAHRALARLARTFNALPLMAFSIGLTRFVISSKPDTAKEILNSSAFADRPVKESAYELLFHRAMGFAPYGDYWRALRRISSTYLFSPTRISAFSGVRCAIGDEIVGEIRKAMLMDVKQEMEVRRFLHFGSLNNVMKSVFGTRYNFGGGVGDGTVLEELVSEGYELLGMFNWSDHFPLLGLLDLQGVRRRCRTLVSKVSVFVGNIIEEHRLMRRKTNSGGALRETEEGDFVDVLLDLENDGEGLSESDMIAVLWEMIFRGTDTVAILLEWILARMVLHPDIQSKAQAEIDRFVGGHRPVSDSDLPNLPYLQAIVKESLRVHPPGPLLSWARLAIHDVHIGNNFIPAGTTAMVNMWAITHDENVWSEPNAFKPERFLNENVGIMGTDLRLAPFGAGRRVCPGKALGLATVHLWLAQLLQNFNWVASDHGVDLTECLKLSMEMKKPLICKALPRTTC
ncbi:hypothetical protein Syun_022797 [Stephania yunnanensis]|uniref:Cytochrome P450 n=1 Tax=Stephania yunnanensis TaxID=152371 RepID=A0AAP0I304_9MAGN